MISIRNNKKIRYGIWPAQNRKDWKRFSINETNVRMTIKLGFPGKTRNMAKGAASYLDSVSKAAIETDNMRKGQEFEKYVADIFKAQSRLFALENWSRDPDHKHGGVRVEPDLGPDFRVRCPLTGEEFFVVCEWRARLSADDKLEWCKDYALRKYHRYSQQLPVFVVIGLGGEPISPNRVFCIPLKEARWTELLPGVYLKHERHPPGKKFFWRSGTLS